MNKLLLTIAVIGITPWHSEIAYAQGRGELSPEMRKMISWFPEDTETITVVNAPVVISFETADDTLAKLKLSDPQKDHSLFKVLMEWSSTSIFSLLNVGEDAREQLRDVKVELSIEGSRRFRTPEGLGAMPYDGCRILTFEEASNDKLSKVFREWLSESNRTIQIGSHRVAVFERQFELDTWTIYVVHPQNNVLLWATSRSYLEELLLRMEKPSNKTAFPKDLELWKHVDVDSPIWGLRQYSRKWANNDPSSPLNPTTSISHRDLHAKGLVFWYDDALKRAKVRYISDSKRADEILSSQWKNADADLDAEITEVEAGIFEITMESVRTEAIFSFHHVLMFYLGHGLYV